MIVEFHGNEGEIIKIEKTRSQYGGRSVKIHFGDKHMELDPVHARTLASVITEAAGPQ